MAKINLTTVTNAQNVSAINNNFALIADQMNGDILYRNVPDGEANQMLNPLDMNHYDIINAGDISATDVTINGVSLETAVSDAAASAAAAAVSATQASGYATQALNAEQGAQAALSQFVGQYLGPHSTAPTVDGNGNPLTSGDLYFNTVANQMYVYSGSVWQVVGGTDLHSPSAIGDVTPNTGKFTTLTTTAGANIAGNAVVGGSVNAASVAATGNVSGGSISTSGTATVQNISVPGTVSGAGFSTYMASAPNIGTTSPVPNIVATNLTANAPNPTLWYQRTGVAGAVGRLFNAKMNDRVSVKDFGATGNGTTDDTAAVQAAINFLATKGYNGSCPALYFPGGTYLIHTNSLTGFADATTIIGDGPYATQIHTTDTTGDLFAFQYLTGLTLKDFGIFYRNAATSGYALHFVTNVYDLIVDNLVIDKAYAGIGVTGIGVPQIFNNIHIHNTANGGTGMFISGGSDQYIHNCLFHSPDTVPAIGLHIQQSGGIWMTNVDIVLYNFGIVMDPQAGQDVSWLFFSNIALDSSHNHGLQIVPAAGGIVRGINFSNSWLSSNFNNGINIDSGSGSTVTSVRFSDCRIFNNQQTGALINPAGGGTIDNVQFNDCDIAGNSQSSYGTYDAIQYGPNVSQFMICGNRIGAVAGYANSQRWAINITGTSHDRYIIANNLIYNNIQSGIQDQGTGVNKVVNNNLA